jgi:predicted N-acetyltransferase YhbS
MSDNIIRKETSDDYKEIKKVNDLAFKQIQEGELIESLRKRKKFVPDEVIMAIELKEGSLGFGGGMIDYPKEYFASM